MLHGYPKFASISFSVESFFNHVMQDHFWRKVITKHDIQKPHIHNFHNRLLGKVAVILELFSELKRFYQSSAGADAVLRMKVTLIKNFDMKASTK